MTTRRIYLVFSKPPDGLTQEEYDDWYERHVRQNILSPGFISGQRFTLSPGGDAPTDFSHLALYEYEGDSTEVWLPDLMNRIATGEIDLPPWFDQIRFATWDCSPLSDRIEAANATNLRRRRPS